MPSLKELESMDDEIRVELPADLAEELTGKGFEELFAFRGVLSDAGTVMTVASTGLAVVANSSIIIVSREELGKFVAAIRDWVRRKPASKPDGEIKIDFSARQGTEEKRLLVKVESVNGTLDIDTTALTTFITSLFFDRAGTDVFDRAGTDAAHTSE